MIAENKVGNPVLYVGNFGWIRFQGLLFRLSRMRPGLVIFSVGCALLAGELRAHSAQKAQAPEALIQFNASVEALVRKVSPSVVQVLVTGFKPLDDESHRAGSLVFGKQRGIGSGAIIDPDGFIVTN